MPSHVILFVILALTVYQPDETLRRYGAADHEWHLVSMRDEPFNARATITFPARHRIAGMAPCNSYTGTNVTPYPWIEVGPIAATRRACPDLQAEMAYFDALQVARVAVVEGDRLILSDEETPLLVFTARD
ncbi:MAG: META domain-containing protein [Sulfitobacter sp.]|nr:META domain-containing protein [Sulfitobacter sp.]